MAGERDGGWRNYAGLIATAAGVASLGVAALALIFVQIDGVRSDIREMRQSVAGAEERLRADFNATANDIRSELRATTNDIRSELRATAADIRANTEKTSNSVAALSGAAAKDRERLAVVEFAVKYGLDARLPAGEPFVGAGITEHKAGPDG